METVELLMAGKNFTTGNVSFQMDAENLLWELAEQRAGMIIDLSTPEAHGGNSYAERNLSTLALKYGLDYSCKYHQIPPSDIVRDDLYYDILTPEQQAQYQVPVLFDHFVHHNLPIAIYNAAIRNPGMKIVLLFDSIDIKDVLRIHLCKGILQNEITGLRALHFYPVFGQEAGNGKLIPAYTTIPNDCFNTDLSNDYDQLSKYNLLEDMASVSHGYLPVNADNYKYYLLWQRTNKDFKPLIRKVRNQSDDSDDTNRFLEEFVPMHKGGGLLSEKIIAFKNKKASVVQEYKEQFLSSVRERAQTFHYVIRALSSHELSPSSENALDIIGKELQAILGFAYRPDILHKNRQNRPIKSLTRQERKLELKDLYFAEGNYDLNGKNVLIIDDIYTTGNTTKAIKQALKDRWPDVNVFGHFLARTMHGPFQN